MLSPGTTVALRVCAVGLRPEVPVVRLWGLLGERSADYVRLRREIQAAAGPRLAAVPSHGGLEAGGAELRTGDLGLVEVVGLWYRCCVVLNLSSGNEEIVDPENVWNCIPDWACRSSEAITPVMENLQSLPEESLLQEKQTGCSSDLPEDPHVLQHS